MPDGGNVVNSKSSTVHSVVVAVQLLEYLAASGRPQRVTDIATHLGMTKARVSRHLSTLADLELVVKTPDNAGYRLGSNLFRLASAALDQYEITNIAYRYMVVLKNRIAETVILAIPAGGDSLIVSTVDSGKPFAPKIERGVRFTVPVSPTARMILAFSSDDVRERILSRRTEHNSHGQLDFDPAVLRQEMARTRERFHEYQQDPHGAGFSALTAPIFNHQEKIEAAIAAIFPSRPDDPNRATRHVIPVKETALEISRVLGSSEMAGKMAATL